MAKLSTWRIVAAFIVAPLVPAALFSIDKPFYGDFLKSVSAVALVGGYLAALLLGAPALLILFAGESRRLS